MPLRPPPLFVWWLALAAALLPIAAAGSEAPPDRLGILTLLRERNYPALDRLLTSYQEQFEKDPAGAVDPWVAFRTFAIGDPSLTPLIDEWVRTSPGSYPAHLARAKHFHQIGNERRGTKWAKDTTSEQWRGMSQAFEEAAREVKEVLRLNPKVIEAYAVVIGMVRGEPKRCQQVAEEAFRIWPASFRIRAALLDCLLPRWGGSYAAMERVASDSQAHAARNPRLKALKGYVAWDKGRVKRLDKRYEEALTLFNQAVVHGDHWLFYVDRGDIHYRLKAYDKSLADLNRADQILPQNPDALVQRAYTLIALGREDDAVRDADLARRLDPTNQLLAALQIHRAHRRVVEGSELAKAGRFEESIAQLDAAVAMSPGYAEARYWRGRSYLKKGDHERALADFEESIKLDPRHYDSYLSIDWILSQRKEWPRLLGHWNRFLELEPKHADAYLERAGTHRHSGNLQAFARDLARSCELGNRKACEFQKRMR